MDVAMRQLQDVIAADDGGAGATAASTPVTTYGAGYGHHSAGYGHSYTQSTYGSSAEYNSAMYGATGARDSTMSWMMLSVTIGYMLLFAMMFNTCYRRPEVFGYYRMGDTEQQKPQLTGVVAELDAVWRKAFITKVYFILCCQLALTVAITFGMMQFGGYELARWAMGAGYWTRMASMIATFATLFGLMCHKNKHPLNLILLVCFTSFLSYLVGLTCTFYAASGMGVLVVEAFAITSLLFVGLTAFVMYSKIDFSFLGLILPVLLLTLIIWGFFVTVFFDSFQFRQVYALAGCVIFALYILYDTSNICNTLEFDDYVFGAVSLYLDFINLFLMILTLLTSGRRE